ncbi:MAG: hypothetical protein F6K30_16175 [Cyanothece sp. SIO2G6]|nr:hypothetical protein [Cyanothece sp. SIO2G6]
MNEIGILSTTATIETSSPMRLCCDRPHFSLHDSDRSQFSVSDRHYLDGRQ